MAILEGKRREFLLLFAMVFLCAATVIWVRTNTVKATYLYVQNQKELVKLQQEMQKVRVQWLKQTSPKRLDALAAHLGLNPPKVDQVMQYEKNALTSLANP